jgi:5-methylthioadenosine/S-adenosylhomocysteine deaminase
MATRDGARALGLHDRGILHPGAKADFIRIDLDRPGMIPVAHPEELIAHLGWLGSAGAVTDVWVDGDQVVAAGTPLQIDVERAAHEVRVRGRRLAEESGT